MGDTEGISGPWRATKLWNNIIRNFRGGMPLKKHKKNLRTYESCFSSTEAIDWLHKNLQKNPNFGSEVTKEQTVQLLKKLHRAGIIENVKDDSSEEEFKLSGELYRFSNKSPVRNLRTPGKENRKPLADTANTPRLESKRGEAPPKPERDKSVGRKAKEEMKKQLNFSYFQNLPMNSLIILDNDDIWRKVYMTQLSRLMTTNHTERLDYAGQLDMDNVTHNMTKVSSKGIVQLEDKSEDLPHWVLSAMKCLANWPRQLRTVNGEESCLPSYPGFESDVFNVVKDYFLGLQYPLTTCTLYEFLLESYQKAEGKIPPPTAPKPVQRPVLGCNWKPGQNVQPGMDALYGYTQNNIQNLNQVNNNKPLYENEAGCFYKMTDSVEDFAQLSNQERVAKIKQTFQILPPLATSSLQNSNNTSSSLSGHTTFDAISYSSMSPGQVSTRTSVSPGTGLGNSLPPKTCYETAFVDTSPITRIVPQKDHEVLHIKRSYSGRSLLHIPSNSIDWATKTTSTQTEVLKEETSASSLKRLPRWKRTSRFRKSIAIMDNQKNRRVVDEDNIESCSGVTNHGFVDTPSVGQISMHPTGTGGRANMRSESVGSSVQTSSSRNMRGFSSVDNLLDKEKEFEEEFMLKYRQVSGDLRGSCDLVQASRTSEDSRYLIQSKTVRKEKKKRRYRGSSEDRHGGYNTDSEIVYDSRPRNDISEVNERYWQDNQPRRHRSSSNILEKDSFSLHAPLAMDETVDLSPVPFDRNNKYNTSYRMATNQPATPLGRSVLPRTSTKIRLPQHQLNQGQAVHQRVLHGEGQGEEIYSNGLKLSVFNPPQGPDDVFTGRSTLTLEKQNCAGSMRGNTFRRNTESRMSRCSQATVDSGRYSDISRASTTHRSYLPIRQHTVLPDNSDRYGTIAASRTLHSTRPSAMGESGYGSDRNQTYHQQSAAAVSRQYQSMRGPPTGLRVLPTSATAQQSAIRTIPPRVLSEKLSQLPVNPGKVEEYAINVFKLLTLLIPPCNRRKLQLLLKFIRKVSLNHDLTLSNNLTNREYSINTFTPVILRPTDPFSTNPALDRKIVNLFIDKYEEIWSPPESLRSEVEDKVYRSLVNRRLEAGEDPYPITYCKQVTKQEYEEEKLTGGQAALLDLLEAMIADIKMTEKEKIKKLKKFKSAYPEIWRRKFSCEDAEPPGMATTSSLQKINKFSSLSRIKNRIGM